MARRTFGELWPHRHGCAHAISIIFGFVTSVTMQGGPANMPHPAFLAYTIVSNITWLVCVALIMIGFWKLTEFDPAFEDDTRLTSARRMTRIAMGAFVAIWMALAILYLIVFSGTAPQGGAPPSFSWNDLIILMAVNIVFYGVLAWLFFACMLWARELARRATDAKLYALAKSRMISVPLWSTVGILACGLGPLIGFALYYTFIVRLKASLANVLRIIDDSAGVTRERTSRFMT
ncbi:MAG: hypothetical protein AAGI30_12850 [Planctomycetota bacterium]